MTASPFGVNHPDVVVALAARYKLPAVYPFSYFVRDGGLFLMALTLSVNLDPRLFTSTAFSRARNLLTCQCRHRQSTI